MDRSARANYRESNWGRPNGFIRSFYLEQTFFKLKSGTRFPISSLFLVVFFPPLESIRETEKRFDRLRNKRSESSINKKENVLKRRNSFGQLERNRFSLSVKSKMAVLHQSSHTLIFFSSSFENGFEKIGKSGATVTFYLLGGLSSEGK